MKESRLEILLTSLIPGKPDTFILYALALEYRSMNRSDLALEYFKKVLEADQNYLAVFYQLGALYQHIGDKNLAEEAYHKGIRLAASLGKDHTLSELKQAYKQFLDEDEF